MKTLSKAMLAGVVVVVATLIAAVTYGQVEPIGGPYTVDEHTRLLLHFDGDFKNESPMSADAVGHGVYYFLPNDALGLGQCLRLSNSSMTDSAYATVADTATLDLTGDWTIEGWLNIFTFGEVAGEWRWVPRLIIKPGDDVFWHPNYWVEMWGDNRLFHTGYYDKEHDAFVSNSSQNNVFAPGVWVHLTFIRDNTNHLIIQMVHDDQRRLLSFVARGYDPVLNNPPNTTAQDVHIGWAGTKKIAEPSNDSWLDGFVDEIRVSDVVRNFEIPPVIAAVTSLPNQSTEVSSYEVEATVKKVGAPGLITKVALHYNVGSGWVEVVMTLGADGVYRASIPGQPLGSRIRYYVSAEDNTGYRTLSPANAEDPVEPSYYTFAVFQANTQTLALGFEEGQGVPQDASLYHNPVTVVGHPTYSSEAKVGTKSLYFPGDTTRLVVDSPFLTSPEFTLDFWMKPDTMVNYTRIILRSIGNENYTDLNYAIRYEGGNIITARFTDQTGGSNVIQLDTPLELHRWYHVTYEVSKDSAVFQILTEDGQVFGRKGNKVVSPPINAMGPLRIGNGHNIYVLPEWADRSFKGLMDDIKIYNYPAAGLTVSVKKEGAGVPKEYALMQNFPNPFNPTTEIVFALPKTEKVTLAIYDVLGRKVKTLLDRHFQPGQYSVSWDGTDQWGRPVASGIYLYRLQTSDFTKVRKMTFIK